MEKLTDVVCHDVEPVEMLFYVDNVKPLEVPVRSGLQSSARVISLISEVRDLPVSRSSRICGLKN
jgi:hypothetical protein